MSPHAPATMRPSLLTLLAALVAPTAHVAATPKADAGLLRLCAAFHDADARCHAAPDDGAGWKVWLDRRWEITAAIEDMAPRTEAGRRAKARVALTLAEEASDTSNEYERFTLATLRDLAGSAAA